MSAIEPSWYLVSMRETPFSCRWAWLLAGLALNCGPVTPQDAGTGTKFDAGAPTDAGQVDAGRPDAGRPDAGPPPPFDAGPPPPQSVFGSVKVNGVPYQLTTGFGTQAARTHQLRMSSGGETNPRLQVSVVFPADAGARTLVCGGPEGVLLAAQYSTDGGVAFFNLNPTCTVVVTQVAWGANDGGEYRGTFTGTLDFEPRSALDAGFPVMNLTDGTFRVVRTF